MQPPSPEETGKQMAQALVASLELLKQRVGGGPTADPAAQARAGALAVEALKQLLPDVVDDLRERP